MGSFVAVLIIITSVLLILVVLAQNSKGGGLTSNFSSTNQVMGVRKTADFMEKATWALAIALFVFCIWSSSINAKGRTEVKVQESYIQDEVDDTPALDENWTSPQAREEESGTPENVTE